MDASDTSPVKGQSADGDDGDTSDTFSQRVGFRLSEDEIDRLDRAVYQESQPGVNLSRSDIIRAALGWYLDLILDEEEDEE